MIWGSVFKGKSDGGGVRSTKETKESRKAIYGSFGKTHIRRKTRAFSAYSPPCPSVAIVVKWLGPPHRILTHQLYAVICNQCSFVVVVAFKSTPSPPFQRLYFFEKL